MCEMDIARRPMKGYVFVAIERLAEDDGSELWVKACRAFAGNTPMKVLKEK